MSYMARIEDEILNQLELLANGDVKCDDTVKWIKKEILDSYKRGIATAKQDTERKTTLPEKVRRAISKQ